MFRAGSWRLQVIHSWTNQSLKSCRHHQQYHRSLSTSLNVNMSKTDKLTEKERPPFNYNEAFRVTESPQPNFKPGTGGAGSEFLQDWRKKGDDVGYTTVDPEKTEPRNLYRLLIGGVIPRPIAFVSSIAENGTHNLAPFSYFNVIGHDPPLLIISCSKPGPDKDKDTAANIRANKTFTVNIISEPFVDNANWTSVNAPRDVDEWFGSGLTMEKSTLVAPPRVKESAFSMECELWKDIDLVKPNAQPTGVLIIGLIKLIHVRNDILIHPEDANVDSGARPFTVDPAKLRAVSRMGGITYGRIGEGFETPRPVWNEVKDVYSSKSTTEDKKGTETSGGGPVDDGLTGGKM
ncbi:hypothetical protein FRB94_012059 [Tulasnella sp. JGI-2019a]|nr:hypothetical protein FRB94_012059 [Tulasnella sp. JGI-2019a]